MLLAIVNCSIYYLVPAAVGELREDHETLEQPQPRQAGALTLS